MWKPRSLTLVPIQDSAVVPGTPSALFLESLSETTEDAAIQSATAWTPHDDNWNSASQEELARTSDSTTATQEIARLDKIKGRVNDAASTASGLVAACAQLTNEAIAKVLAELRMPRNSHMPLPWPNGRRLNHCPASHLPINGKSSTRQRSDIPRRSPIPAKHSQKQRDARLRAVSAAARQGGSCPVCALQEVYGGCHQHRPHRQARCPEVASRKGRGVGPLSGAALESVCDELATLDVKAADALRTYHAAVAARKAAALALLKEGEAPEEGIAVDPWPASPEAALQQLRRHSRKRRLRSRTRLSLRSIRSSSPTSHNSSRARH